MSSSVATAQSPGSIAFMALWAKNASSLNCFLASSMRARASFWAGVGSLVSGPGEPGVLAPLLELMPPPGGSWRWRRLPETSLETAWLPIERCSPWTNAP